MCIRDRIYYRIEKYLKEVIGKHLLIEKVLKDYEALGMSLLADKALVMRAMSDKYEKRQMRYVYSIIWNHVTA